MKVRIYQIAPEFDIDHLMFRSFTQTLENGPITPGIYECVYEKELPVVGPERVYQIFNTNLPADYHGRSLSISDIVEFEKNGNSQFFFCDTFGFSLVKFDKTVIHETAESRKQK